MYTSVVFFVVAICSLQFRLLLSASVSDDPATPSPKSHKCPPVDGRSETCVCQHDKGIIDVTPLANNDGTAKFTEITDSQGYSYDYNPCNTFKAKHCKNKEVYNCQIDGGNGYIIGDKGTEEMWINEDGDPFLYYTGSDARLTIVYLICDQFIRNYTITTSGDSLVTLHYVFDLTSCHVCPGGCVANPGPVPGPGGGGGKPTYIGGIVGVIGIVVIILVLVGIVTYFVAGSLIMKFHYESTGTDIIPNRAFWVQLPFLVKDGCVCTFGPCFRLIQDKVRGGQGYQKQ